MVDKRAKMVIWALVGTVFFQWWTTLVFLPFLIRIQVGSKKKKAVRSDRVIMKVCGALSVFKFKDSKVGFCFPRSYQVINGPGNLEQKGSSLQSLNCDVIFGQTRRSSSELNLSLASCVRSKIIWQFSFFVLSLILLERWILETFP